MRQVFLFILLWCGTSLDAQQFKVLLFTKTSGWHHESILDGVQAVKKLGERHHFQVDWQENADWFTDEKLKPYDLLIFLNTTGDILNAAQQQAMERFLQSGKGFVGIHSASDTEYDWPWYTSLVGRMFVIHPAIQTAYLKVEDRKFPGLDDMHDRQLWTDEWYHFGPELSTKLHYILSVDETTYDAKANWGDKKVTGMGSFHPIAWYQYYDGGRSFYSALGHLPAVFSDTKYLTHLYGGIYWAATGKGIQP